MSGSFRGGSAARPMMEFMRITAVVIVLALALLGTSVPAPAFSGNEQEKARQAVQSGEIRPLDDILKGVRRRVDGRVLDATLDDRGGEWVYWVKVLGPDGRVRLVRVDGRSGKVLGVTEGGG